MKVYIPFMKAVIILFVVLFFTLSNMNPLYAQWVQTNGPYGGVVKSFAASKNNIFAGIYGGGVFRSTNGGTSWTAVNSGLTDLATQSLVVSGNNLFVGTYFGDIFLSTNN
ncbi:MAG: regulator, partial [Bacteroidota bacterium]